MLIYLIKHAKLFTSYRKFNGILVENYKYHHENNIGRLREVREYLGFRCEGH